MANDKNCNDKFNYTCYQMLDFTTMLDGHNVRDDAPYPTDICKHHHHLWYARGQYLQGKPRSLEVLAYFKSRGYS